MKRENGFEIWGPGYCWVRGKWGRKRLKVAKTSHGKGEVGKTGFDERGNWVWNKYGDKIRSGWSAVIRGI